MSKSQIVVGLDVGSSSIRSVILEETSDASVPRVIGVGEVQSVGVRRGLVVDADAVAKSCHATLEQAERMAGHAAHRVMASLSGADIECHEAIGVVAVGRTDGEVVEDDINRVFAETQARLSLPLNREVVHVIPKSYRLDDQKDIKDPIGMKGVRLELTALVISGSTAQLKNVGRALELSGARLDGYAIEPLATSEAVLHPKQKELGVVLINIGGGTTSLAVYEDGDLLHVAVLPVGSGHVTNDIAIGLRTSIETAEAVKLRYGTALPESISKKEEIDLSLLDGGEEGFVSHREIGEIVEARLEEIFQFVNSELKKISRDGLLPGGAVLTGGGALIPGVVDLAKRTLRLPAQIGYPKPLGGILDRVDTPEFATAVGLALLAEESILGQKGQGMRWFELPDGISRVVDTVKKWTSRFLP